MIRFYNGRVLRFGGGIHITDDEVWVEGSRIKYVGPHKDTEEKFDRQIDLRGDLLMPGFKNAHTHTAMTFLRSLADDLPLQDWLNNKVYPNEAKLTDEIVYYASLLGIMEYLSSGMTANFDMYFHNEGCAKASADAGFRTVILASLNNFDRDIYNIEREYLRFNNYDPLISYRLGIHAEYTTCMERMEYLASLAEKYAEPVYLHLSETKGEVEGCIERYGITPPQLMDRLGMYRYGGGGIHCVWFTDEDIELFSEKGLWAVTCPASNLKLASGIAPIHRSMRRGMRWAIGTDGAASNNALDMFREMYLTTALQKYYENYASAMDAAEVLKMACVNGAYVMGLDDADGVEEGKLADLTVIDLSKPNMRPINCIEKNIVYSGSKQNVRLTMVNGRVLYENGEYFIGIDPMEVYTKTEKLLRENNIG